MYQPSFEESNRVHRAQQMWKLNILRDNLPLTNANVRHYLVVNKSSCTNSTSKTYTHIELLKVEKRIFW